MTHRPSTLQNTIKKRIMERIRPIGYESIESFQEYLIKSLYKFSDLEKKILSLRFKICGEEKFHSHEEICNELCNYDKYVNYVDVGVVKRTLLKLYKILGEQYGRKVDADSKQKY